jgi:hypothetical protein
VVDTVIGRPPVVVLRVRLDLHVDGLWHWRVITLGTSDIEGHSSTYEGAALAAMAAAQVWIDKNT